MSEDLKTIKELADEIGVSKQAVWQKIKKESSIDLRQFTSKKGKGKCTHYVRPCCFFYCHF